jgi:hypothetical protein
MPKANMAEPNMLTSAKCADSGATTCAVKDRKEVKELGTAIPGLHLRGVGGVKPITESSLKSSLDRNHLKLMWCQGYPKTSSRFTR